MVPSFQCGFETESNCVPFTLVVLTLRMRHKRASVEEGELKKTLIDSATDPPVASMERRTRTSCLHRCHVASALMMAEDARDIFTGILKLRVTDKSALFIRQFTASVSQRRSKLKNKN